MNSIFVTQLKKKRGNTCVLPRPLVSVSAQAASRNLLLCDYSIKHYCNLDPVVLGVCFVVVGLIKIKAKTKIIAPHITIKYGMNCIVIFLIPPLKIGLL
jgi:hypothetical protein